MPPLESQRLDKWLWVARFFKTRSLAADAISGGKVHVDGQRVKPARNIKPGTLVRVRKAGFEISVEVLELAPQRGPAVVAQTLYRETPTARRSARWPRNNANCLPRPCRLPAVVPPNATVGRFTAS